MVAGFDLAPAADHHPAMLPPCRRPGSARSSVAHADRPGRCTPARPSASASHASALRRPARRWAVPRGRRTAAAARRRPSSQRCLIATRNGTGHVQLQRGTQVHHLGIDQIPLHVTLQRLRRPQEGGQQAKQQHEDERQLEAGAFHSHTYRLNATLPRSHIGRKTPSASISTMTPRATIRIGSICAPSVFSSYSTSR